MTSYIQITRDNHTWFGENVTSLRDGRYCYCSMNSVPNLINKSEHYGTYLTDTIVTYTTEEFQQLFPELFI